MAKPEWGTKRTCPKCGTRFYDLGKEPAECIDCGHSWTPEPVLKSKQPVPVTEKAKESDKVDKDETDDDEDDLLGDDDIELDEDGDDVLADDLDDDDDDVTKVIDAPVEKDEN